MPVVLENDAAQELERTLLGLLGIGFLLFLVAGLLSVRRRRRATEYMCSGCLQIVPPSRIHVIPSFNGHEDNCVTSFRCEKCWLSSLDQTRRELSEGLDGERPRKLRTWLGRNGITGLSANDGGALLAVLGDLKSGRLVLRRPI